MERIDAYTHCGLDKYEPIETVGETMRVAGVSRAVLVQHLGQFDNRYLAGIAQAEPDTFAAVALVNHEQADWPRELARLADGGHIKGIRIATHAWQAAPSLPRQAVERGLIIVLYTPQGVCGFHEEIARLCDAQPNARLVITHLGNPSLDDAPGFDAYGKVFELAKYPGVYLQLSGMKMVCPYPHEALHPLVAKAARHFGPDRICWGSNYPVVGDADDYRRDLNLLIEGRLPVPADSVPAVAGGNALRLWFS